MIEKELTVKSQLGIHLRPAALLTQTVNKYKADIKISNDQGTIDGRSIMGLMLLTATYNSKIKVVINGADENELWADLQNLVEVRKFDEE